MVTAITQFEELFRLNYATLCSIANNIVRDKNASRDIVQEVFERFWRKHERLLKLTNTKGYLFRATTNACIDYLEKSKKTIRFSDADLTLSVGPNENITIRELEMHIQKALAKLPPKCKVIFMLSRFEEMKYKEIAQHLGISVKTVENQMGIALEKMRNELKPFLTKEFLTSAVSAGVIFFLHLMSR